MYFEKLGNTSYTHTHTHTHIYIYIYIHTYIHTYIQLHTYTLHTCIHTHICTYIHSYIHTYIHLIILNIYKYEYIICTTWQIPLRYSSHGRCWLQQPGTAVSLLYLTANIKYNTVTVVSISTVKKYNWRLAHCFSNKRKPHLQKELLWNSCCRKLCG